MPDPKVVEGLHLPTFDKEQDIAAAKTSAPDEDTSTTALGVSTSELPKEGASLPFILGEGLPPVAAKLVVKIQRGDFVDMAELMRDNMEAERRAEQDGAIGSPFNKRSRRREVPDLLSWIQCFGTYISVVVTKSPAKVKQLLAYQTMIVREACRCGGKGWQAYDSMFCQQAANNPTTDWSQLNNSLYSVTFLANQNGRGRICEHCLETDHALAPYRPNRPSVQEFPKEESRSFKQGERAESRERVCYSWNDGRCPLPYCRYRHICARCHSAEHRAVSCTTYPDHKV